MTRVKICGVTRADQAVQIADLGADALGLNFVPGGRRRIDTGVAAEICQTLGGRLSLVAVLVDPEAAEVEAILSRCDVDHLQFSGTEPPEACARFGLPYIKAVHMRERDDAVRAADAYADAAALLLDTFVPGQAGGTGETFDWAQWPGDLGVSLMLAGGLTPCNVAAAIRQTRPFWVDVASGVERGEKGVKDMSKVQQFLEAVAQTS